MQHHFEDVEEQLAKEQRREELHVASRASAIKYPYLWYPEEVSISAADLVEAPFDNRNKERILHEIYASAAALERYGQ